MVELQAKIEQEIRVFIEKAAEYQRKKWSLFATSSFQTHSIPLVHLISKIAPQTPVYFLDTGFHFPETHNFALEIGQAFGIDIVKVQSPVAKINQRGQDGSFHYATDPDYCCYLNKTLPTEALLREHDVWINGIRKDQNANRNQMPMETPAQYSVTRFHPMLNWTSRMIYHYIAENKLPAHPLEKQGYMSIGCRPCTRKFSFEESSDERNARWQGMNKTECGLHTDLVVKK